MEEKGFGAGSHGRLRIPMPDDAELISCTQGYEMYFSKSISQVIIQVKDYHPGDLYLSKKDLSDLIDRIS